MTNLHTSTEVPDLAVWIAHSSTSQVSHCKAEHQASASWPSTFNSWHVPSSTNTDYHSRHPGSDAYNMSSHPRMTLGSLPCATPSQPGMTPSSLMCSAFTELTPSSLMTSRHSDYSEPETNPSSPSSSEDSTQSTASDHQLQSRAPITYNEAALSWLHGQPQIKIFQNILILIEDKDKNSCKMNSVSKSDLSESP